MEVVVMLIALPLCVAGKAMKWKKAHNVPPWRESFSLATHSHQVGGVVEYFINLLQFTLD